MEPEILLPSLQSTEISSFPEPHHPLCIVIYKVHFNIVCVVCACVNESMDGRIHAYI